MTLTAKFHVGRSNDAAIAQLNHIHGFGRKESTNATSEVGLLSVRVLRRESETLTVFTRQFYRNMHRLIRTVGPVETAAPDRVVENVYARGKSLHRSSLPIGDVYCVLFC